MFKLKRVLSFTGVPMGNLSMSVYYDNEESMHAGHLFFPNKEKNELCLFTMIMRKACMLAISLFLTKKKMNWRSFTL